MRKLLFIAIAVLGTSFAFGQTITDKHGNVFDISKIEQGSFVDYHYISVRSSLLF